MATCSYLCKQQRIRRQGGGDPSYYSSRCDIATHCDHVAVRMNCTKRRGVRTQRHNELGSGSALNTPRSCSTLWGRRAWRSERCGAAKLLNNHATLHHKKKTKKRRLHPIYHCWPTAHSSSSSSSMSVCLCRSLSWFLVPASSAKPRSGKLKSERHHPGTANHKDLQNRSLN